MPLPVEKWSWPALFLHHGADGEAEGGVSVGVEVADEARVNSARAGLEFRDDLAGPLLSARR